jgi:hypothetical protein
MLYDYEASADYYSGVVEHHTRSNYHLAYAAASDDPTLTGNQSDPSIECPQMR